MNIANSRVDRSAAQLDVEALDDCFEAARPRLLRLCASLVGADQAEDVVQDGYLAARRNLGQLQDHHALEAWLKRIVVNLCYDQHRRRKRLLDRLPRLVPDDDAGPKRSLALRELVERLPARQRTVLVLYYAYGYALNEIAELLSLSHVNVRSIIARTRRQLLSEWQEGERG